MKHWLDITTDSGPLWYTAFYVLSVLLAAGFFLEEGRRRQYPMAAWALVFATGTLCFILGSRMASFDPEAWHAMIHGGEFRLDGSKSVIGGIIFGLLGIHLAGKALGFSAKALDAMAIGLPLAMAVQRIGCFMAGCCHGLPTDAPWAVRYTPLSVAYHHHLQSGLIESGSPFSAPIHPNQIYHALLCLLVAAGVWIVRKKLHRPGSQALVSVAFYGLARFLVEYTRDSEIALFGITHFAGLKSLQWLMVVSSLLLLLLVQKRERGRISSLPAPADLWTTSAFLGGFGAITLLADRLFTPAEHLTMRSVFGLVILLYLAAIYSRTRSHSPILAAIGGMTIIVITSGGILTGQMTSQDSLPEGPTKRTINEAGLRYGNMRFNHYHAAPTQTSQYVPGYYDICGGWVPEHYVMTIMGPNGDEYTQRLRSLSAFFLQRTEYGRFNKVEWSTELTGGLYDHPEAKSLPTKLVYNAAVRGKVDTRWAGVGLGLHLNNTLVENEDFDIVWTDQHATATYFNTSFSLRIFPYDIIYLKLRFNELLPYANSMRRTNQFVIGTGLGRTDGTFLEFGGDTGGGIYWGGKIYVANRLGISFSLVSERHANKHSHFPEMGLSYLFPATPSR